MGKNQLRINKRYLFLSVIAAMLILVFSIASPSFFSVGTLRNLLRQNAALLIVSVGLTFVMLTGGNDLSVGANAAVSAAVGAYVMQMMGGRNLVLSAACGILSSIAVGTFFGLVNGVLVGYLGINGFITTLGTMSLTRGLAKALTESSRISISNDIYNWMGQEQIGILPVTIFPILIISAFAVYLLKYSRFGRNTYAVGGNRVTARAAGINARKHIMLVYVLLGAFVGVASIISAGRVTSAQALANTNFEFEVITAVILGGTSLFGGVGTIAGTLFGCLIMAIINTGILMLDIQYSMQYFAKALLIVAAVYVNIQSEIVKVKEGRKKAENKAVFHHNAQALEAVAKNEQRVLSFAHISKAFPGVQALTDISFDIERGKVHALMGENGAGKSTLMKILSGVYQKDEGEILIDEVPVNIASPVDSQKLGISIIYQEFALVPEISITKNIFLGKEIRSKIPSIIDSKKMKARTEDLLKRFGMKLNVGKNISELKVGQQQMIEIAKAISSNAWIVVMDEPTAAITEADKERLFDMIRELKANGIAIVYISHRMSEIFEIADTVTVLRDGRHVVTAPVEEMNEAKLIKYMVGRELSDIFNREKETTGEAVLEVKNLYRKGVFEPVSFVVREGEVLGLSGLMGAGRTEICRCIFGLDQADGGEIYLNGKKLSIRSTFDAIQEGICMVSEDRKNEGIVPLMSVRENISLPSLPWLVKFPDYVDKKKEMEVCEKYVRLLEIKTPSGEQQIKNLSGGNQQKVCLAKWLARSPKLIILDEPTRGIDVGAKKEIHQLIGRLAKEKIAVIMISSELPEILGASDRIMVLCEGKVTALYEDASSVTQEMIMVHAAGGKASVSV